MYLRTTSIALGMGLVIGLSACGNVTSNSRGASKDSENNADQSTPPEELAIGDGLKLSDAELSNIQARISHVNFVIKTFAVPKIKAAVDECVNVVGRFNKIKADLAAAGNETLLLQAKRESLVKIIGDKVLLRAQSQDSLSSLQGKVSSLKEAIASFGPTQKAKLMQLNRDYNDRITKAQKDLVNVRAQIDAVIQALPFDAVKFAALDKQEDELSVLIADLKKALDEQVKLINATGAVSLEKLKADLVIAEKELADKGPALKGKITELAKEIRALRTELASVVEEIENNAVASKIVLPIVPAECGLLGIK